MLSSLLALAAAASSLPAQTSSDVSWGLFPFLNGNMDSQIPSIVNDAANRGVDTLYVSLFRATGPRRGDLWITDYASWNPAWGAVRRNGAGIDVRALIAAAHARNIAVVGVLKCFDTTVQPTDASHRAYLLDVVDYFTRSYNPNGTPVYDLDGLALDYIRYVSSSSGGGSALVTNLVRDIKARIGVLSLHAYLIANRFSFDGPTYDLRFNSYSSTMSQLQSGFGQDWEGLAQHLDVLMPMAYTADGNIYTGYASHLAYVQQCALYARQACTRAGFPSRRVTPVIKTYTSSGETTTSTTIGGSIDGAFGGGGDGYQSFRWATMRSNSSWMNAFHARTTPGANWPIARFGDRLSRGLSLDTDAQASTDLDEATTQLQVRFDLNDDGRPDTSWATPSNSWDLMPEPGTYRIGAQVRDSDGHVSSTTRLLSTRSSIAVGSPFYSAGVGGNLDINVDAGPAAAGSRYLTLVSLSGSTPGFTWNNRQVPLTVDGMTIGFLNSVNTPVLMNGLGLLDAQGRATATFWLPPGILAPLALQEMTWAAIAVDPLTNAPRFVTNSARSIILN